MGFRVSGDATPLPLACSVNPKPYTLDPLSGSRQSALCGRAEGKVLDLKFRDHSRRDYAGGSTCHKHAVWQRLS